MRIFISAFSTPKASSSPDENEDSFWVPRQQGFATPVRVVIADGASESYLSALWAKRLARSLGAGPSRVLYGSIEHAVARWPRTIELYRRRRERRGKPLAWFEEQKIERGSHATMLGLEISTGLPGSWEACAIGDSCLFHVRGDSLLATFPQKNSTDFDSRPALVSSLSEDLAPAKDRLLTASGAWEPDDTFYLATDALAAWFFREVEAGRTPWIHFRDLQPSDSGAFTKWVEVKRQEGSLRNDDTTLARVELP